MPPVSRGPISRRRSRTPDGRSGRRTLRLRSPGLSRSLRERLGDRPASRCGRSQRGAPDREGARRRGSRRAMRPRPNPRRHGELSRRGDRADLFTLNPERVVLGTIAVGRASFCWGRYARTSRSESGRSFSKDSTFGRRSSARSSATTRRARWPTRSCVHHLDRAFRRRTASGTVWRVRLRRAFSGRHESRMLSTMEIATQQYRGPDRRQHPTRLRLHGRRRTFRRDGEGVNQVVDQATGWVLTMVISSSWHPAFDALCTAVHIQRGRHGGESVHGVRARIGNRLLRGREDGAHLARSRLFFPSITGFDSACGAFNFLSLMYALLLVYQAALLKATAPIAAG